MDKLANIKQQVNDIITNEFKNQLEQYKKFKYLQELEYQSRDKVKMATSEYAIAYENMQQQIKDDLDKYRSSNIFEKLNKYTKITEGFCNEFKNEQDKKVINLYIQYVKATTKQQIAHFEKKYKWIKPIHYVPVEFQCTFCNHVNIIKNTNKNQKYIHEIKCANCNIKSKDSYRENLTEYSFFKTISAKEIHQKFNNIFTILKDKFSKQKEDSKVAWSKNNQYIKYQSNQHKLPYKIRKFLKMIDTLPETTMLKFAFETIYNSSDITINELERYGILKIIYTAFSDYEIAYMYLKNLRFECENIDNYWNDRFNFEELQNILTDTKIILKSFDCMGSLNTTYQSGYILNEYFFKDFNNPTCDKNILKNNILLKSIFQSKAELRVFKTIEDKVLKSDIIIPKYPLWRVIDFENKTIKQEFNTKEIEYLKRAFFNYIILDKNGYLRKVFELQVGEHHTTKAIQKNDNLKQSLCAILNVDYEELF